MVGHVCDEVNPIADLLPSVLLPRHVNNVHDDVRFFCLSLSVAIPAVLVIRRSDPSRSVRSSGQKVAKLGNLMKRSRGIIGEERLLQVGFEGVRVIDEASPHVGA